MKDKDIIKENVDAFKKVLTDFKENPKKYENGKRYKTNSGAIINVVYEDQYSVFGNIISSNIKAEIGFCNIFHHSELTYIGD